MSIAVVCNLSDGVILGADSAITVTASAGAQEKRMGLIAKIYNEAEKVFGLSDFPIGIANFGVGMMEARSIGGLRGLTVDPGRFYISILGRYQLKFKK